MTGSPPDLSHLHPTARETALRPAEQRLAAVRSDRWIGHPRADRVLQRLDVLRTWSSWTRKPIPNLLITGPANNGKSTIVEKFHHEVNAEVRQAALDEGHDRVPHIPIVLVQMPPEPSPARFYNAVLQASNSPDQWWQSRSRTADLERDALWRLSDMGLRMLIVDDIHNVLAGQAARRREFIALLRDLGSTLRVPVVTVGTHDAHLAAIHRHDPADIDVESMVLPLWRPDDPDTRTLLARFAASFPLRRPSPITTDEIAAHLLERSESTIGELTSLLVAAATVAITSGEESINAATLGAADYLGPSERRRTFDRAST